jgi:hypothetical protein
MNARTIAKSLNRFLVAGGIALVLACGLALHWLVFQGRETVPGVTTRPLGPRYVDWFDEQGALVLSCPRTDMIRLWPLPVVHPWFEEPISDPSRDAAWDTMTGNNLESTYDQPQFHPLR